MIKKKCGIILICIITSILAGCSARSSAEIDAAIMANFLKNCPEKTRYGLYDIDDDGSMELFIAENNSHADAVTILVVDDKNHELLELGSFGSWGSMSYYPGGYIVSGYTGQGTDETTIYRIADGQVSIVHELWDNSGTVSEEYQYKVDGENVAEEKYYELYNQYTDDDDVYIGYDDFTPIDVYDVMYDMIFKTIK